MEKNIKSRVEKFCRYKGISVRNFCSRIGAANGYFKESLQSISLEYRTNIGQEFPELSLSWLILGEGSMLNDTSGASGIVQEPAARYSYIDDSLKDKYIRALEEKEELLRENYELKLALERSKKTRLASTKTA